MDRSKIVIIASILVLLCMVGTAYADTPSMPEIPTTAHITKDNDISASFLSNLFGRSTWQGVAGDAAADDLGGMGRYNGLIVGLLGMINIVAMIFASAAILYRWGIIAVDSAHRGSKVTDSNLFWEPVRHAFGFTLTVPVLNGLSFLQVIILTCVSFSINFANFAWDWAGEFIIDHSQAGIVDNSSPLIEEESLNLIMPMFQAVLISEHMQAVYTAHGDKDAHINRKIAEQSLPTNVDPYAMHEYKSVKIISDRYVVEREPLAGRITVYVMPGRGMPLGQLGRVEISTAKQGYDYKTGKILPLTTVGQAKEDIALARVQATIKAGDELRVAARHYLQTRKEVDYGTDYDYKTGLEIARDYRRYVNENTDIQVAKIKDANDTQELLETALDSHNGKSRLGWVSAGLFSSALAQRQRTIDEMVYDGSAVFAFPDNDMPDQGFVGDMARFFGSKNTAVVFSKNAMSTFNHAPLWASQNLLGGRVYNDRGTEGDGPGIINRFVASLFLDGNGESGIVATTLSKLRTHDPIVVLSDFGDKMWTLAAWLAGGSVVAGLAGIGTGILTSGTIAAFAVGVTFKVVAALTVVTIWIYAILHWIVRVIEALVAAPFWAVMHLMPEGSGFAGTAARKGYTLLLDILLRPFLLVFGACVSVALWIGASQIFTMIFGSWLNSFMAYTGGGFILEIAVVTTILGVFYYQYAKLFVLMTATMPDRVNNWFGSVGGGMGGEEASGMAPLAASGAAMAKGGSMLGGAATGAAGGAKALYDKARGKDKGGKGDSPANIAEKTE